MKQTSLAFGQRKSCTTVRECAGHTDLGEIRTCKYCFTISFLKKKCGSTPNVTTGDMLGQWGTKEQMLQRLLKNSEKKQRLQIVEVKQKGTFSDGADKSLLLFFLFCQPNIIATIFVVVLLLLFFFGQIIIPELFYSIYFETAGTQFQAKQQKKPNLWGLTVDEQGYPMVAITMTPSKKGWVAKGRLKFKRKYIKRKKEGTKLENFRYPHHRKVFMFVCLFVEYSLC